MKRFFIGLLLAFVFYFVGCMVAGGVAGFQAGMKDPQNAQAAGARAGEEIVTKYWGFIMVAAVAFGVLGSLIGVRPASQSSDEALPITTWV
jgi:amino acid transporter